MSKKNGIMEKKQYHIGLALSGGGVRGFAHIGALRALEDVGIKPDIIAGVSAGSVVASFYASGMSADEIFELFSNIDMSKFLQVDISKSGFLKLDKFKKFISKNIPVENIEQLALPSKKRRLPLVISPRGSSPRAASRWCSSQ